MQIVHLLDDLHGCAASRGILPFREGIAIPFEAAGGAGIGGAEQEGLVAAFAGDAAGGFSLYDVYVTHGSAPARCAL